VLARLNEQIHEIKEIDVEPSHSVFYDEHVFEKAEFCVALPVNPEYLLIEFLEYADGECDPQFQSLREFLGEAAGNWPTSIGESCENRMPPLEFLQSQLNKFLERINKTITMDPVPKSTGLVLETISSNKQFAKKWSFVDQTSGLKCFFVDFISEFIPPSLIDALLPCTNIDPPKSMVSSSLATQMAKKTAAEPPKKKSKAEALAKEAATCQSITNFFSKKPVIKN
jgi:hypothetical protein